MVSFVFGPQDRELTDLVPVYPARPAVPVLKKNGACSLSYLLGALALLSLCIAAAGVSVFANSLYGEKPGIEQTLDQFLTAMSERDSATAYGLLSSRARQIVPTPDLNEQLRGFNFALYSGYLRTELTELNMTNYIGAAAADEPQGWVATVSANVLYEGGYRGNLVAVLEKEANSWRIWSFQISVPPAKIGNQTTNSAFRLQVISSDDDRPIADLSPNRRDSYRRTQWPRTRVAQF